MTGTQRVARFDRRNLYALLLGCVLALGLGEGACRILGIGSTRGADPLEERTAGTGAPWPYQPGSTLTYQYPDNPRGYFDASNTVTGSVNAHGFRGRDTDFAADPATTRLAFLGDSFTLGVGVRDEHTLPALVEADLREDGRAVEVLNFGASGSSTTYQVQLLRDYVLRFEPDIVTLVVFLNDAGSTPTMAFLSRPWYLRRIRRHSWLANAIVGRLERNTLTRRMVQAYNQDFDDSSEGYREMKSALREGARLAAGNDADFVVAVYPVLFHVGDDYPFAAIHTRIGEFCRSEGIRFIDLQPAFAGRLDPDLWVHATDQHSNEIANGVAARLLADRLTEWGLIERERN